MKYKITDLMDLYEDRDCPLTPLDRNMQKIETNKEIIEVKQSKHAFSWAQGLGIAASVALLVLSGFGVKALLNRTQSANPGANTTVYTTAETMEKLIPMTTVEDSSFPPESIEETQPTLDPEAIAPKINPVLSVFAQQGIQNADALTTEEDLVEFAFAYFSWNENCFSLTLDTCNEFLSRTVGQTVSPADGASYWDGHLTFRNGVFSMEPAAGDQHPTFAIYRSMDCTEEKGRVFLSVTFSVFEPIDIFADRTPLMQLTEEEADAKVLAGELQCIADGQARLEVVDGHLRVLEYQTSKRASETLENPASQNISDLVGESVSDEGDYTESIEITGDPNREPTHYSYHVPCILADTEGAKAINADIDAFFGEKYRSEKQVMVETGTSVSMYEIDYDTTNWDGILSLIVHVCYPNDCTYYNVYNYEISTGRRLNTVELLERMQIDENDFVEACKAKIEEHDQPAKEFGVTMFSDELLLQNGNYNRRNTSVPEDVYGSASMIYAYPTNDGQLTIIAEIPSIAGAGSYWHVIPLELYAS